MKFLTPQIQAMLVPSMTVSEVRTELLKDFETVRRKFTTEGLLLQKEMLRKGLQHQVLAACFKTARHNQWNVLHQLSATHSNTFYYIKTFDAAGMVVVYSFIFDDKEEAGRDILLVKYYKHFFDRYNQRMGLGFSDTSKTVKHFFKRNIHLTVYNTEPIENRICCSRFVYQEGLGMCWKDETQQTYHVKTFISEDMYTKNQQKIVNRKQYGYGDKVILTVNLEHLRKVG